MKDFAGTPGTFTGLFLRMSQCFFAAGAIASMVTSKGFFNVTAFCYLIASMALQVIWSFGLAFLDAYFLAKKKSFHNHVLLSLFVVGDWVSLCCMTVFLRSTQQTYGFTNYLLSISLEWIYLQCTGILSLAAAASSAGVTVLYFHDLGSCSFGEECTKFQLSVAFAFLSWISVLISSLIMFWIWAAG